MTAVIECTFSNEGVRVCDHCMRGLFRLDVGGCLVIQHTEIGTQSPGPSDAKTTAKCSPNPMFGDSPGLGVPLDQPLYRILSFSESYLSLFLS